MANKRNGSKTRRQKWNIGGGIAESQKGIKLRDEDIGMRVGIDEDVLCNIEERDGQKRGKLCEMS